MDYPGAFMEYQEAYRIPWRSIEFQEAPWNTKELSRNTKKFVGIPGGRLWRSKQTDRHPHTYTHQEAFMEYEYRAVTECQEIFMQYKEAFMDYKDGLWNRKRLFWNIKKLIPRSPYSGASKEYQEALSNSMKLDGIPRRIPRTCPEIRRSSLRGIDKQIL